MLNSMADLPKLTKPFPVETMNNYTRFIQMYHSNTYFPNFLVHIFK